MTTIGDHDAVLRTHERRVARVEREAWMWPPTAPKAKRRITVHGVAAVYRRGQEWVGTLLMKTSRKLHPATTAPSSIAEHVQ